MGPERGSWHFLLKKMASQPVKGVIRTVKPIISTDYVEARRRVINLYKAWYREIPPAIQHYSAPISPSQARAKLKEEFMKNKDVRDIRIIDMLVIKGQMELKEIVMKWKQRCHFMYLIKDTVEPKPKDFMEKFLSGAD